MTELELVADKLLSLEDLSRRRCGWRTYSQRTVFTNGVFDLIHPGHLTYLAQAAALGQRLIVGVNSDASVKGLKGESRPIMPLAARMQLLASLFFVDGVIAFDTDTPLELIKFLRPDVLVKGGDYQVEDIVGYREVIGWGGEVTTLPFLTGHSSTGIIERMSSSGLE
ncbi:D-glycero-beta-D-manno-heptose 1-phosphate adenylyltransferase [Neolewinella lacunae]|uniref:D-glycero-beta-D-manno-heptose 1-phosphate adenylyltransferase n=1 Tax=Neolewinella lacunae TaxID=1517758 RepID=A0A923PLZ2_9BACT|nr:D-glycero-beta-D-manno-heptose 1-phosphate adenylyltransferase [Neolewinella lacunae]MBC6993633.1 D-glycero-beta-D-manno-heptose 1-phosphate adenylyltransferase [Neolewinella lacunae]MDN3635539.1 D-glycero-beta-D-manno-heptose 1-phosphate adenylyltransferase [Neolewinella lacunae]